MSCCCSFALYYILTSLSLELSLSLLQSVHCDCRCCCYRLPSLRLLTDCYAKLGAINATQSNGDCPASPLSLHSTLLFLALLTKSALAMAKAVWGFFLLCLGLSSTSSSTSTSTSSLTWTCVDFYQARDRKKKLSYQFFVFTSCVFVCVCVFCCFFFCFLGPFFFVCSLLLLALALALALFLYWFLPALCLFSYSAALLRSVVCCSLMFSLLLSIVGDPYCLSDVILSYLSIDIVFNAPSPTLYFAVFLRSVVLCSRV